MSLPQCLPDVPNVLALPSSEATWQEWVHYGLTWSRPRTAGEQACARPTTSRAARPAGQHELTFHSYREATPGPRWQVLFDTTWPAYRSWYTARDLEVRPSLAEARAALREHMPELLPHWERLVELAGGDPLAARMLTMWRRHCPCQRPKCCFMRRAKRCGMLRGMRARQKKNRCTYASR